MPEWVKYISGPLIGMIIGYLTNYLAVRMLFRPYKPHYIFKMRIPFTPGIIPKRKKELSKAIGNAVGNNLFTKEDIKESLNSSETSDKIIGSIMMKFYQDNSISDELISFDNSINIENVKEKISNFITDKLVKSIENIGIKDKVVDFGMNYYDKKKDSLGMLSMFINSSMIDGILSSIGTNIEDEFLNRGKDIIYPYVKEEVEKTFKEPINELTINVDKNQIFGVIKNIYFKFFDFIIDKFINNLDIAKEVQNKVDMMSVKELEELCLSVMKKELNAIVNLGALIGLLIGVINIFI